MEELLYSVGDSVSEDDVVAVVETDKVRQLNPNTPALTLTLTLTPPLT